MKKGSESKATRVAPVRDWIKAAADDLAEQYHIDASRACRILERIAGGYGCQAFPNGLDEVIPEDEASFISSNSLHAALDHLQPEDALTLFEHTDLDQLRWREDLVINLYVGGRLQLLYTLDELADVTAAFIAHLEQNRQALLRTGLPRVLFKRSGWLNWLLASLYPTRRPLGSDTRFGDDVEGHTVTWRWPDHLEDAPPWKDGLAPADATRLEALRERLLDLEIAILRELLAAARARSVVTLWPHCLHLLTEALSADDADFLLRMDRFYQGFDAREDPTVEQISYPLGGLTGLLQCIGGYEEALTTRRFARLRETLLTFRGVDRPRIPGRFLDSYYQIRDPGERERLDAALDAFLNATSQASACWADYRRRVNEALETEFYTSVTVVVEMRVRRPVAHKFEPHLRDYADFAKLHLEATGNVPRLPLAASAAPPTTAANIFRNDGHYWTIKFAGVEFRLKNAKGVRYIAHLLHTPQQKVHILGLIAAVDAPQGRPAPTAYTEMTQEELAAEHLRASRKDGVDDMALVLIRKRRAC